MGQSKKTGKAGLLSSASLATLGVVVAAAALTPNLARAAEGEAAGEVSEVIVSTTRVNREGYVAPTPVTTISRDVLDNQAMVLLSDVVFTLPAVRPSSNGTGTSQAAGNYANLRGFGATRTLTLVDGKRFVPSNGAENSGGSSIDLNMIPSALIDRIEVVTGGASAAWGSDAIGGVLNLVMKRSLIGVQGRVQYDQSERGDAKIFSMDLAAGNSFQSGRGQFMVAGEYSKSWDMPRYYDREFSARQCGNTPQTIGGVAYAAVLTCGLTLNSYTDGGVITNNQGNTLPANNPLYGRQFLSSTSSSPFNYGQIVTNQISIGGYGGWKDGGKPVAPVERKSIYARVLYDFTPDLTATFEASFAESGTNTTLFEKGIPGQADRVIEIFSGNPYIPADIQAIMTARNLTNFFMSRLAPELDYGRTSSVNRVARLSASLEGRLGGSWSWDAYITAGHDWYDTKFSNNIITSNFNAAIDVVINPRTGQPDCRQNVTGPSAPGTPAYGAMAFCVPANPFGPGSLASAKDYIQGTLNQFSDYEQYAAGATVRGEPFSSWAGPVSTAVGVDFRREWVGQIVHPYADFVNPPVFASGGFQASNPKSFRGGYDVTEGFGEMVFPLLKDQSFAKSLDLNGAARVTNYTTSGTVTTWKVGATYEPVDGVMFRAARSRDIRAAGLFESYGANTTYGTAIARRPDGSELGQIQVVSPGRNNPDLEPEKADTTTLGVTFRNFGIPRLYLAVDYYNIQLKDTIGKLGSQAIIDRCFGAGTAAGQPRDPAMCALVSADQATVVNPFLNLGTLDNEGMEFDLGYTHPADAFFSGASGDFSTRVLVSNTWHRLTSNTGLNPEETAGDVGGGPHWKANVNLAYRNDTWGLSLQAEYLGKMTRWAAAPPNTFVDPILPAVVYLDLGGRYNIMKGSNKVELYFSVKNLLDKQPPWVSGSGTGSRNSPNGRGGGQGWTNVTYYDFIGRSFAVGARVAF